MILWRTEVGHIEDNLWRLIISYGGKFARGWTFDREQFVSALMRSPLRNVLAKVNFR